MFLRSFLFRYRRRLLLRPFFQAGDAVAYLRHQAGEAIRLARFLTSEPDLINDDDWEPTDRTLTCKPGRIRSLVEDRYRFEWISVAIIDYEMPGLNGVEVCRRIRDLPLRKIMLTGKADQQTAVAMLNEGLIDAFLIKQQDDVVDQTLQVVRRLQAQYFAALTEPLRRILELQPPAFLQDPRFQAYAATVLAEERAVEHYLTTAPPGLLSVRADGTLRLLLVQDEHALIEHQEVARDTGLAPPGLMEALAVRDRQPWFPTVGGHYLPAHFQWEKHLYPAERVGGWYCSRIDATPDLLGLKQPLVSYAEYRKRLAPPSPL